VRGIGVWRDNSATLQGGLIQPSSPTDTVDAARAFSFRISCSLPARVAARGCSNASTVRIFPDKRQIESNHDAGDNEQHNRPAHRFVLALSFFDLGAFHDDFRTFHSRPTLAGNDGSCSECRALVLEKCNKRRPLGGTVRKRPNFGSSFVPQAELTLRTATRGGGAFGLRTRLRRTETADRDAAVFLSRCCSFSLKRSSACCCRACGTAAAAPATAGRELKLQHLAPEPSRSAIAAAAGIMAIAIAAGSAVPSRASASISIDATAIDTIVGIIVLTRTSEVDHGTDRTRPPRVASKVGPSA